MRHNNLSLDQKKKKQSTVSTSDSLVTCQSGNEIVRVFKIDMTRTIASNFLKYCWLIDETSLLVKVKLRMGRKERDIQHFGKTFFGDNL